MPKKQTATSQDKAQAAAQAASDEAQDITGLQADQPLEEAAASAAEARSAEALATGDGSPLDGIRARKQAERPEGDTDPVPARSDEEAAKAHQRAAEAATRLHDERSGRLLERLWQADGGGYRLFIEAEDKETAHKLTQAYTGKEPAAFVFTRPKNKPPFGEPILRGKVTKGPGGKESVSYERG